MGVQWGPYCVVGQCYRLVRFLTIGVTKVKQLFVTRGEIRFHRRHWPTSSRVPDVGGAGAGAEKAQYVRDSVATLVRAKSTMTRLIGVRSQEVSPVPRAVSELDYIHL